MAETLKNIEKVLTGMWNFCMNVWNIIQDPTQVIITAVDLSHWILLLTSIICLILTMAGCKKTKHGATISIIVYIVIRCIAVVLI